MASGLSSISSHHQHFFRDLVRSMRADARGHDPGGTETVSDETEIVAEAEQSSDSGAEEMITALESRNSEVMSHEASHMAAAGAYINGGASYTYQTGPDGKQYAIGGQVSVDMSPVPGDPGATITKMMAIRAAALSPSDPSGQDVAVAAAAAQIEAQARAQLNQAKIDNPASAMRTVAGKYGQQIPSSAGTLVNAMA